MKKYEDIKRETGVTLIILVVTIVVILILAGITANMAFDNNGIIKSALGLQNKIQSEIHTDENRMNKLKEEIENGSADNGSGILPNTNNTGGSGGEETVPPTAPKLEVTGTEGESGYYISDVEIKVMANDRADSLTYAVEGTEIEQGSISTEIAIGNGQTIQIKKDGTYTITVFEYNRNGQKSEGSVVTIARDTQKPTVSLAVTKTEGNGITVQLVATDPEPGSGLSEDSPYTFYYQEVGIDTWIEAGKGNTSSYTYENLKENTSYNLKAEVTDKAGNIGVSEEVQNVETGKGIEITGSSEWEKSAIGQNEENSFTITTDQPVKVSDTPNITLEPNTTGSSVTIEAIHPDANGYATEFKVIVTGGEGSGTETVIIGRGSLVDEKGSAVQEIRKEGLIVDNEAPTITSVTPSTTDLTNVDITITGTAIDSLSGIVSYQYSKEETLTAESEGWNTVETTTNSFTAPDYTITENGTYYFYVKDSVGNVSKKEIEIQNIDTTKPTITNITGPTETYLKLEGETTYTIETSKPTTIIGTPENHTNLILTGEGIAGCTTKIEAQNPDEEGYATTFTITIIAGDSNGAVDLQIGAGLLRDKAGNENESSKIQTGLIIDNTPPIMTISPETNTISKNTTITVSITDTGSGLSTDTVYSYTISPSQGNPIADGYIEGTYEPNTPFTIGETLTGTYYVFLAPVQDAVGNKSLADETGNYRTGPYLFDNTAPTVTSVVTSNPKSKGFTVTIQAEDNQNGSGLADENTYVIYYKTSKATGYTAPVTTADTTYTFDNLDPTIDDADITQDQANEPYLQEGMNPVIWVDLNGNGSIEEEAEEIVKYTNLENKTLNPQWTTHHGDDIWAVYNNCTVTYDVYVTAVDKLGNISNPSQTVQQTITPPIDHKTSHFANVRMEEDGSYFTWIPRYAYKITETAPSTEPSVENTGYINTKFIEGFGSTAYDGTECTIATSNIDTTTQYVVHPAFCENVDMGGYGTNLSGIWVAKYESSMETNGIHTEVSDKTIGDVATNDTIKVVSKPNVSSWRNITTGKCYTNGYHYNRKLDSHMMKNSEWGAMAYITHSQYGRNGNEVTINNSLTFITGNAGDTLSAEGVNDIANAYNTTKGQLASVTGNIYGIYDMSGGTYEFVTAWNLSGNILDAGSNYASSDGKSTKYATAYDNHTESSYPTIEKGILGDAIYEVNLNPGTSLKAWFSDHSYNVWTGQSFFCRGGFSWDAEESGIFASGRNNGDAGMDVGYRIILPGAQQLPTDGSWSDEKGVNTPQVSGSLNPVMWIDKNGNGTIETDTEEIKKYSNITTKAINPEWTENNGDENWYDYTDNGQTLESKIDHKQSKWANVIDEDTGSYFVWIPRYAYKITPTTDPTPSANNAGIIDVKFVKNNTAETADGATVAIATSNIDTTTQYVVHPSFCEDVNMGGYGTNLYGIWVAKYEASQEKEGVHVQTDDGVAGNVVGDNIKAVFKPDVTSWRYITIGNCYINGYNYNRNMDSHMMKNSEWGATAYLTHSQYGRNGNEISNNNSSRYFTGRSSGSPVTDVNSEDGTYAYHTTRGGLASTTGNITGIYDLSGGANEYFAGWNAECIEENLTNGTSFANYGGKSTKYATVYHNKTESVEENKTIGIIGDVVKETYVGSKRGWFNDLSETVTISKAFTDHGGYWIRGTNGGIFYSGATKGETTMIRSFRIVLPGAGISEKDKTRPVISVSPGNKTTPSKSLQATITITDPGEYSAGIAEGNSYNYYLSPSNTTPTADGYITGTYESGNPITIGTNLNGSYYLYIQQVFDNAGNKSTANITENEIGYYQTGPYQFDSQAPIITSISKPSKSYIKNGQTATYTITTNEAVTIADSTKMTITGDGSIDCTVAITGNATTWEVTVTGGTGEGAITLNLAEGLFQDIAGNLTETTVTQTGLTIDNTAPTMTVSPASGAVAKTRNITVTIADTSSGLVSTNQLKYYLSTSSTNPTATGYKTGTYTSGTAFSIGSGLTGTYYLFLPKVADNVGNTSTETITGYYRCGTYLFDNTAPTVSNVVVDSATTKGFKVTITATDTGTVNIKNYTIYYKASSESSYKNVTTTSTSYTFTNLLASTTYNVYVTASDTVGNTSENSATKTITTKAEVVEDGSWDSEKGVNGPYLYAGLNPVIWVNGKEITKYANATTKTTINSDWKSNNGDKIWYDYKTGSGDHKSSQWANAIDEETGSYFVWIPRYAYKITSTATDTTKAGTIDVKFMKNKTATASDGSTATIATSNIDSTTQYIVHPVFCTDVRMGGYGQELSGIWVAKYESSREDSADGITWTATTDTNGGSDNLTTNAGNTGDTKIRVVSKPNVVSWRYGRIRNFYTNAYNYNRDLDSHLMKNSEWRSSSVFNT